MEFRNIRNETNIGPDANFEQCFSQAHGKYVWIVGDDDIVLQGGVAVILDLLSDGESGGEFDIVHIRGEVISFGETAPPMRRKPAFEIISDASVFTLRTHVFLTFITGNIINKRRVLSLPHGPFTDLIGTNLVQLGWTFTAVRFLKKAAYSRDPIIASGIDHRGGLSLFNIFGANLKRVSEEWLVEPALVRIMRNGTLQVFFPPWALETRLGRATYDEEELDKLLQALFPGSLRFYLFVYPVLKLPKALAGIWLFLGRVVNRLDRALGNPLLR
jgi:abequosyltransferase